MTWADGVSEVVKTSGSETASLLKPTAAKTKKFSLKMPNWLKKLANKFKKPKVEPKLTSSPLEVAKGYKPSTGPKPWDGMYCRQSSLLNLPNDRCHPEGKTVRFQNHYDADGKVVALSVGTSETKNVKVVSTHGSILPSSPTSSGRKALNGIVLGE